MPSKIDFESTKPRRALKTSRVLPYLLFPEGVCTSCFGAPLPPYYPGRNEFSDNLR